MTGFVQADLSRMFGQGTFKINLRKKSKFESQSKLGIEHSVQGTDKQEIKRT
jgi:hypothetical protein